MKLPSRRIAPVVFSVLAMAVSLGVSAAPAPAPASSSAGMSDREKVSYAVGMKLGTDIVGFLQQVKGEVDVPVVLRAITSVVTGSKTQMTVPEAQATLQAFGKRMQEKQAAQQQGLSQKNLTEGAAFLASNGKKPGVKTTASGLEYQVILAGSAQKPKPTDTVKVNYVGTLLDGSTFDSSAKNGGPISFQLNQVVPGWTEGLQLMGVGGKFVFWVPSKLGYGANGSGPIGPNAVLKFEIELVSIGNK